MNKIICYGDSNTFGYDPKTGYRFDEKTRWSGILKSNLKNYIVIEEGLNNRTGFVKNPCGMNYCATEHLEKILKQHKAIKFLILAVGINDLQNIYNTNQKTIELGLLKLINQIKSKNILPIIIPPPILDEKVLMGNFSSMFDSNSITKSNDFQNIYKEIATNTNCHFFNFNNFTKPSEIDGLHYSEESHMLIGQKLTNFINTL